MEKKYILIGIVLILIVLALFLFIPKEKLSEEELMKIKEAEISLEQKGVKSVALSYPKYQKIELEYYYKYDHCNDIIKNIVENFKDSVEIKKDKKINGIDKKIFEESNLDVEENKINLPIIILEGKVDIYGSENVYIKSEDSFKTIINGISACSEKILTYDICRYLKEPSKLCDSFNFIEQYTNSDKYLPSDFVCYDSCNIEYISNGNFISQNWQGPPCSKVGWYVEGESKVITSQCYGKDSCKSQDNDLGCCFKSQCVNDGKCYEPLSILDIDSDEQKEICVIMNNSGVWVNADRDKEVCNSKFKWLECSGNECVYGTDNYDNKENGLCCGDDKDEYSIECEGKICNGLDIDDFACCTENSCVYNGKCYKTGCTKLKLMSGKEVEVYCNSGKWEDLDDNFCSECLGKKAWSGLICCGDDEGEGKYPTRFIYNNKDGNNIISYDYCTDKKNNCVFPESNNDFIEGCYQFDNSRYFDGGYYCSESQWYDLDNNSDLCRECSFNWLDSCCGDDKDEYYVEGEDVTFACCSSATDIVVNGKCYPTVTCGDDNLESGEQCETPNSLDNEFCRQSTEKCFETKLGTRDSFGNCESDCNCYEDEFELSCAKDICGAECGTNSDCGKSGICDQSTCSCREKTFCGDIIIQEVNDDNWNEECELPNTLFNPYCNKTTQCFGIKTGIRYEYGTCDGDCQCSYASFQKICVKGSCGAECNEDGSGCDIGEICSTDTCSCIKSDVICGNGVCETGEEYSCPKDCIKQECPYRIDIEFDKDSYYDNDTMDIKVYVYDINNNLMPNIDFDLDVIINNNYIDTFTYSTLPSGFYERKKRVTSYSQSGTYEYIAYIAKAKRPECNVVSDSVNAFVYVRKPAPMTINLSRYEYVFKDINIVYSVCGNNIIERGEACEGSSICRMSIGCNYETRTYDIPEACNNCHCPSDLRSSSDDEIYCKNCDAHCEDGVVNCNEQCEGGTLEVGNWCRDGNLYDRIDTCNNCQLQDDGIENDVLISDCFCECPEDPNACIDGNWIEYRNSYHSGCNDGKCNVCNCEDTYTKDTNNDGVEDKCSPEICGNGIDDNDNGLVDMGDSGCSLCQNCGLRNFNICDRKECISFIQECYFNEILFGYGDCYNCSSSICEDYWIDEISCIQDTCSLGDCYWDSRRCCTDKDNDHVCNDVDNCPNLYNPDQKNSDNDKRGDNCEICIYEPLLFEPIGQKELICNDRIDDDCDGMVDCHDTDCTGIENCCQSSLDCEQSGCIIESCVDNKCIYQERYLCDNSECPPDYYCDFNGECTEADISENICLLCIDDKTKNDWGIGFGSNLFNMDSNYNIANCCGNQDNEYYIIQGDVQQAACCDSATDCIDYIGNCIDSNTPNYDGHLWHCSINKWYECSENKFALCAEAGSTYNQNIDYKMNRETGWYCIYDGFTWSWKSSFPKEVCVDGIDNNCNGLVDINDTDCLLFNISNSDLLT